MRGELLDTRQAGFDQAAGHKRIVDWSQHDSWPPLTCLSHHSGSPSVDKCWYDQIGAHGTHRHT
jgi:hypothetical protein